MPIYTRTGDDGTTGILGGHRAKKTDLRFEAIGTIDELNDSIGFAMSLLPKNKFADIKQQLLTVQDRLFCIGSNLAKPDKKAVKPVPNLPNRPTQADIDGLEKSIDKFDQELFPLKNFILPGGHSASASLQVARSVCRRAERRIIEFSADAIHCKYINRLSDYLFTLARVVNSRTNNLEEQWKIND